MNKLTVSTLAGIVILIGSLVVAIQNIESIIPYATADDLKRVEQKADQALLLGDKLDLMDVKADIRAIERTPEDERSPFEKNELEELKTKKKALEEKLQ